MKPSDLALQERLLELSEYNLTVEVVHPLLASFGFGRLEYFGGSDEEGKDTVCWRANELGDIELGVAQVKRYKPSKRARDKRSFSEIVTQISQALEKELPFIDGSLHRPSSVYFITPHQVDIKVLRSRFEAVRTLRFYNIKIIDGPRLVRLLLERLPKLVGSLCGPTFDLGSRILEDLHNNTLMRVLNARTGRDIGSFYTDLDLALTTPESYYLIKAEFRPVLLRLNLPASRWKAFCQILELIERVFFVKAIRGTREEAEELLEKRIARNVVKREELADLDRLLASVNENLASVHSQINDMYRKVRSSDEEFRSFEEERAAAAAKLEALVGKAKDSFVRSGGQVGAPDAKRRSKAGVVDSVDIDLVKAIEVMRHDIERPRSQEEKKLGKKIRSLDRKIAIRLRGLKPLRREEEALRRERRKLVKKKEKVSSQMTPECYSVQVDGQDLSKGIYALRAQLVKKIEAFNQEVPEKSDLYHFLLSTQKFFEAGLRIFSVSEFRRALGLTREVQAFYSLVETRLRLPVDAVFDTNANLLVLGDAGAGKTTSLQNYARKLLESKEGGRLVLFGPIAQIVRSWTLAQGELSVSNARDHLEDGIAYYLHYLGASIEPSDFSQLLSTNGGILLLDGIDEAIKSSPWITGAIRSFAERFPNCQVVASSRVLPAGLEVLPFPAITLLPFTEDQCRDFVRQWFCDDSESAGKVNDHLRDNKRLDEVVRSPLLATILCVLEEHSVPLPRTELRLYEERMRLLLGDYDVHKGLRRIRSQRYVLGLVAQKLAFHLHASVRREGSVEEFVQVLAEKLKSQLSVKDCKISVEELIHPCGILCPMTPDGLVGFGHLRYQEYLAAKEVLENRAIDFVILAGQAWWRGTLGLFSQMNTSITWLLNMVGDAGRTSASSENLKEMIGRRPVSEQRHLLEALSLQVENEKYAASTGLYATNYVEDFQEDESEDSEPEW